MCLYVCGVFSVDLPNVPNMFNKNVIQLTGMRDGQKIVMNGEGDQEPGLEPGDFIIVLDQQEHPQFTRYSLFSLIHLVMILFLK